MNNQDFDLDNFKKDWKEDTSSKSFSSDEMQKMLNKKSIDNVMLILIISVVEFLIGLSAFIFLLYYSNDYTNIDGFNIPESSILKIDTLDTYFNTFNVLYLLVFVFFIYNFFKSYKNLSIYSNLSKYISQIIDFRKWVKYFIIFNLIIIFFFLSSIFIFAFFEAIHIIEDQHNPLPEGILWKGILSIFIITLLFTAIYWVYYKIAYGILLGKLKHNLDELKQLEDENNTQLEE